MKSRVFVLLFLSLAFFLFAGGSREAGRSVTDASSLNFPVATSASGSAEASRVWIENAAIPQTVQSFAGLRFVVSPSGTASFAAEGNLGFRTAELRDSGVSGGIALITVTAEVLDGLPPGSGRPVPGARMQRVEFSTGELGNPGSSIRQPAQAALEKAIRASRLRSGSVRLLSLEYSGSGRFRALVEVRP